MSRRYQKFLQPVMVLLCVGGAWISGELLKEHAGPWPTLQPSAQPLSLLCGAGQDGPSGCAVVKSSKWSAIDIDVPGVARVGGRWTVRTTRVIVPVAFIGLAYFVFLGVWQAFAGPSETWGRRWGLLPLATVLVGAFASMTLMWAMFFKFEALCRWCMVTHAINGLLLAGTVAQWRVLRGVSGSPQSHPPSARRVAALRALLPSTAGLRTVGFAACVIAGLWVYRNAKLEVRRQVAGMLPYKKFVQEREKDPAFLVREFQTVPVHAMGSSLAGNRSATAASVVIFSDFECPHCRCFATRWRKEFRARWSGPLDVMFRHLPLSKACNESMTSDQHPHACDAGYAAEAARLQGGDEAFWRMHDALFAQGRRLGEKPYAAIADRLGLDGERLAADMTRDDVRRVVVDDAALAARLGVTETPAVFIGGRRVPSWCLYNPVFWAAVSGDLARSETFTEHVGAEAGMRFTAAQVKP